MSRGGEGDMEVEMEVVEMVGGGVGHS